MSLYLIEQPLALKALHLWAGQRGLARQMDEGLILHHLLGEVFGPAVLQPFRLLVAPEAKSATLYAYAATDHLSLQYQARAVLTPDNAAALDLGAMRALPRPPDLWHEGMRLGFDLKLRPVVRLASALQGQNAHGTPVQFAKGAEVDAFLAQALRGQAEPRETVYLNWLEKRLAPAAQLDLAASRLASFERNVVHRNGKRIEGPEAVVHGTLTVTDPHAFAAMLAQGIGRHKAYGYGMLLLRPLQKMRSC